LKSFSLSNRHACSTHAVSCRCLTSTHLIASMRTLGASFDKRVKTPCFPVLAIQSCWQLDGTVIVVANIAAKSRTATEALGRPIAVYSCVRFILADRRRFSTVVAGAGERAMYPNFIAFIFLQNMAKKKDNITSVSLRPFKFLFFAFWVLINFTE